MRGHKVDTVHRLPLAPLAHTILSYHSLSLAPLQYNPKQHGPTVLFHFTHDLAHIYEHRVHYGLMELEPSTPIDNLTTPLSQILHSIAK